MPPVQFIERCILLQKCNQSGKYLSQKQSFSYFPNRGLFFQFLVCGWQDIRGKYEDNFTHERENQVMKKCFISSVIEKLSVYEQHNRTVVEQKRDCTYIQICTPRNEIRIIFAAISSTKENCLPHGGCTTTKFLQRPLYREYIFLLMNFIINNQE